jgi:hypothetical protein
MTSNPSAPLWGCATFSWATSRTSQSPQNPYLSWPIKIRDTSQDLYQRPCKKHSGHSRRNWAKNWPWLFPELTESTYWSQMLIQPPQLFREDLHDLGTERQGRKNTHHFSRIQATKKMKRITHPSYSRQRPQFGAWTISMSIWKDPSSHSSSTQLQHQSWEPCKWKPGID